ncbi:MAG: c-type cytochrome [Gemmatimonadota bacterium]|nr:MAG: c-type cytochrome [Gemmatimonadota bacterium]
MSGKNLPTSLPGRAEVASSLAVAVLLLWASQAAFAQERWELTQDPLAGAQVFGSKGCVKCHSVNGLGGKLGPDLGHVAERRSLYDLAATMWNHLPRMEERMQELGIERPQLSEREAGDLVAFLFTLDYFDPPGDSEAGEHLFQEKKCVVCHQVGVSGGVLGPSLDHLGQYGSPILVAAAMWNHGPGMQAMMEDKGIERPAFSGSELTDLIAYLESISPPSLAGPLYVLPGDANEGRVTFAEKGCAECHSVQGVGGREAPDLARREVSWNLTQFAAAMWNKAPGMTAHMRTRGIQVPQLGAGEMADLVAYLHSVHYFAESGDVEAGRRLLRSSGCLTCHSLNGQEASAAGNLAGNTSMVSPAEVISALWNHAVYTEAGDSFAVSWPVLSAEEMADIAAFLQTPRRN